MATKPAAPPPKLTRCPYCGQKKRIDRATCEHCNDLPAKEPL